MGGGLLKRRPWLAGALLGLITVKPQLTLLLPIVLCAGRRWWALAGFLLAASALGAATLPLFGAAAWFDYVERISVLRRWILEDGTGVWHLMISPFVMVRHLPASVPMAYVAQGAVALLALIGVALAWRSTALIACSLLATPYMQVYDLVTTALVPVFLSSGEAAVSRGWRVLAPVSVPLILAPFVGPWMAQYTGVGAGWVLLIPAAVVAVRAAAVAGEVVLPLGARPPVI